MLVRASMKTDDNGDGSFSTEIDFHWIFKVKVTSINRISMINSAAFTEDASNFVACDNNNGNQSIFAVKCFRCSRVFVDLRCLLQMESHRIQHPIQRSIKFIKIHSSKQYHCPDKNLRESDVVDNT